MGGRKQILTVSAGVVAFSLVLRLVLLGPLGQMFGSAGALSLMVYLQTGRVIRWSTPAATASIDPTVTQEEETLPPNTEPEETMPIFHPLTFTQADAQLVKITDHVGYAPAVEELILQPINWKLRQEEPTVLIIHTHTTESYTKAEGEIYEESGICRTLDEAYNMISVGDTVAQILEEAGIRVLHDRTLHDYPSYNGSYNHARASIAAYLAEYPSITVVIDIHRDALDESGPGLTTLGSVDGQRSAQLMVVAGSDKNLDYPGWKDNLAFGVQLTALLEREDPGITRPLQLRAQRFNLDMTPGSILVEVGGNGDTHEQALLAAKALAKGIVQFADGSNL